VDDKKLAQADIIITTYEKMDSIIRNFYDKEWIFDIATIIIDEIHFIGESSRGPRLESLIVRMNEFLQTPQIIGLSATINNPEFFNSWLNKLGNKTILIKSKKRPVTLHYKIEVSQNKNSTIKKILKSILEKNGQILIFLNTRKATQKMARALYQTTKHFLEPNERDLCKKIETELKKIQGGHPELQKIIKHGISFHHAGLLPKERRLVEQNYKRRIIKVICCTTTLSAGINLPARVVILKDFKRYVTSGYNIRNFKGYYENGDGFSYFMPFSANEVFQMLGRAGRPGLDSVGYGVLLVNNLEEKAWIEDHYFKVDYQENRLIPVYEDLNSGLNTINTLKEQVLLRVYEEKIISLDQLTKFFEKTYFWYNISQKMRQPIPIEELLMIKEITPLNILKLHADPKKVKLAKERDYKIKISKLTSSNLSGYIKTTYGVFFCEFDLDNGIRCSCGFENGISNNFADNKFAFEFCEHITAYLIYLIEYPDKRVRRAMNDIVPKSIKSQYILNYLFEKGLILKESEEKITCSQFGKLIIRLYLYPVSGVLIRSKLENREISTYQDLLRQSYEILISERRVRDHKLLDPVIEWADEEPINEILERYHIMAGDLMSVRENLERIITFVGIIATHLSESGQDIKNDMVKIAEMSETLQIRIHYGIREELFDLVVRLENVGRVRARILYESGYHTAVQVAKESPYLLNRKTGLGVKLSKSIVESANKHILKEK
jgi:helicase